MADKILTIEDGPLELRTLTPQDVTKEYVGWLNDPDVNRFLEIRHSFQTLESVSRFVADCYDNDEDWLFGIYYDDSHIGNVRITDYDGLQKRASLGLLIGCSDFRGRGLGTRVVRLASNWAMRALHLEHLCAGCYSTNVASISIFEKCGYVIEGRLRNYWQESKEHRVDHIALGLIKDDLC